MLGDRGFADFSFEYKPASEGYMVAEKEAKQSGLY